MSPGFASITDAGMPSSAARANESSPLSCLYTRTRTPWRDLTSYHRADGMHRTWVGREERAVPPATERPVDARYSGILSFWPGLMRFGSFS